MSAHGPDLSAIIASTPRAVPGRVKTLATVGLVLGLAGAGIGFATDADRTLASFVANFLYFAGVCQGAVILAVAFMLTQSRWGRPLKRIAESFGLYLPVLHGLLLVFMIGGGLHIYPWSHEPMPAHKAIWLSPGFFIARQVVGLGLLTLLSLLFIRASLRADLGVVKARIGDRAPAWWDRLLDGWQGEEAEIAASTQRQMRLAPVIGFTYAIVWSLVAVDISMSMDPHWFANMFPAWYFMSCLGSALAAVGITAQLTKRWLNTDTLISSSTFHDLGKLNLGFTMFWAYTLYAQYLPIWYGNMTEETGFILLRSQVAPWDTLAKVVIMCCFLVPFAMLTSRGLKKIPAAYLTVTTIISVGLWLERHLVVMPNVHKGDSLPFGPGEIGIGLALLSGLVLTVTRVLSSVPPVPVADPWMKPNPADVHVHPSSGHAH